MTSSFLTFEFTLDAAETVRASEAIERRARDASTLPVVVVWVLMPVSMLLAFNFGMTFFKVAAVIVLLLMLFALISPAMRRRQIRRLYEATPSLSGLQRYEFSDEGLAMSNAGAENLLRWSAVVEAAESKDFFLIYFTKKCAYYLPKRAVASEAREAEIREFLRVKLEERAKHVVPPI